MKPLHYLIFHPDEQRTKTEVKGEALIESQVTDWQGYVWVDKPDGSNEDPFVFSETWLYSYCHAAQLRRKESLKHAYVRAGSYLFFCSGDAAQKGTIQLDTVFIVDHVAKWMDNPQRLPEEFQQHYQNKNSDLWLRHFMHPFHCCHKGKYTYVSRQQFHKKDDYSFLPISQNGDRVEFNLKLLTPDLKSKIEHKTSGRYPVILSEEEKT
ncbi:hypothetical protein [Nostoc sp.]|uniref:hypothetical protein n=1 Tax=Nostoc sp. TaxID=1180 RepID=UPI002FF718F4